MQQTQRTQSGQRDPHLHVRKIAMRLQELIDHLRSDIEKFNEPRWVMFETTEVLGGLKKAATTEVSNSRYATGAAKAQPAAHHPRIHGARRRASERRCNPIRPRAKRPKTWAVARTLMSKTRCRTSPRRKI